MKKNNVIIAVLCIIIIIIGSGAVIAFNISEKQTSIPQSSFSYNREFVEYYVSENKPGENESDAAEVSIPVFSENVLFFDNSGCFDLGMDPGNVIVGFRMDYFQYMVGYFPDPLVRESEEIIYLVYDTDQHTRLYLFYSKPRGNGVLLSGFPIIMKEKLSYQDFSGIKIGDCIEQVGEIDPVISIYISAFNLVPDLRYEQNMENDIFFSSVHLLTDGILQIEYDKDGDSYSIVDITYSEEFILEGGFGEICYAILKPDYIE